MSEKQLREMLEAIEKTRARHASSPAKARRFLAKEGVITKAGRLTKRYANKKAERSPRA